MWRMRTAPKATGNFVLKGCDAFDVAVHVSITTNSRGDDRAGPHMKRFSVYSLVGVPVGDELERSDQFMGVK